MPIPGIVTPEHLTKNLGAAKVELALDNLYEIEGARAKVTVQGGRVYDAFMKDINISQNV